MRRVVSMRLMVSVCALVIGVVMAAPGAYASPDGRSPSVTGSTVGDTIRLSGLNGERLGVTLVKVTDPAYPTDDMNGAAGGNRLVGVQLRITNEGSAPYSDAADNDVALVDTKGQSYDTTLDTITAGPSFAASLSIPPGDARLGYVVFEVPSSATVAQVQFTPDSGTADDVGTWTVPPKGPQATSASPASVVTAFYAAINAADYQKAWDLGGKNLGGDYDTFVSGFETTLSDTITIDWTSGDVVHIHLDADSTMGFTKHYAGTYTVRGGVIVAGHMVQQ